MLLRGNRRNWIFDAGRFGGGVDSPLTITFSKIPRLNPPRGGPLSVRLTRAPAARALVVASPELLDYGGYFSLELRKAVALCLEAVG